MGQKQKTINRYKKWERELKKEQKQHYVIQHSYSNDLQKHLHCNLSVSSLRLLRTDWWGTTQKLFKCLAVLRHPTAKATTSGVVMSIAVDSCAILGQKHCVLTTWWHHHTCPVTQSNSCYCRRFRVLKHQIMDCKGAGNKMNNKNLSWHHYSEIVERNSMHFV